MKYEKCPICGSNAPEINAVGYAAFCNCGALFYRKSIDLVKCILIGTGDINNYDSLFHTFARKAFLAAREMHTHDLKYKYEGYDEWVKTL